MDKTYQLDGPSKDSSLEVLVFRQICALDYLRGINNRQTPVELSCRASEVRAFGTCLCQVDSPPGTL